MSLTLSARSLLDRCVAGEASAWRELHRTYQPQAAAFLIRMGVAPREVDDACQEVFVQVVRYLGRFERRAEFRTWLYKLCISEAARRRRRPGLLDRLLRGDAREEEVAAAERRAAGVASMTDELAAELMRAALDSLGEKQRVAFVLFELQGLSGDEIARITDAPINTVWRRLHEAREHVRRVIEERPLGRARAERTREEVAVVEPLAKVRHG
jgi:RNA polymerase sigma-70 factor (ECF subfamily)